MRTVLVTIFLGLITGCQSPALERVVGEHWDAKALESLNGWWVDDKSEVCRVSKNKDVGVVIACLGREKDDDDFSVLNLHCTFTRIGPHRFVFFKGPFERKGFTFALIVEQSPETITIANPKDEEFLAMVDDGRLIGEIQQPERKGRRWPLIASTADEFVAAIEARGLSNCFDLDNKRQFKRIVPTKE